MKKSGFILTCVVIFSLNSQVFYSGFESWTGGIPDQWNGVQTNIGSANIIQVTSGALEGNFAVKLVNSSSTHKRFTTKSLSINAGETYKITFYARGGGDVRVGLYDGNASQNQYSSYTTLNNASNWTKITAMLTADTTSTVAEFIISVRNTNNSLGDIQVDSFYVQVANAPEVSVQNIQYTTNTSGSSPYAGQVVKTRGVVTAVYPTKGYWIQNGSGPYSGLYIYDPNHSPTLGDSIEIVGLVEEYYDLTEMKNISIYQVLSSGNSLKYTNITPAQGNTEAFESVLVQLNNVVCINTNAGYGMWTVGDGMDTLLVDDVLYAFSPSLNAHYNIKGVIYYSYSQYKVLPRFDTDIQQITTSIQEYEDIAVYPNPFSSYLYLQGLYGTLSIYNLAGKLMHEEIISNPQIDLNHLKPAIYIVKIKNNNEVHNFVIVKE
ncbi:MAG: T9SS type A sorting domain-containing protein [Bacteroidales bacterium]|nr:T9SS type A sorting domain-containing protein [Bacteroidales bacterium]